MKKAVITLAMAVIASFTWANGNQGKLTVKVTNMGDLKGQLMVGVFIDNEKFLEEPVNGISVKAKVEGQEVVFENLPYGIYAVSVIHDENENGELDTFLMIPTEPYGFSNNAMGKFGPPSFEQTKIDFKGDMSIEIKLNR